MCSFPHPRFDILRGCFAAWVLSAVMLAGLTAAEPTTVRIPDAEEVRIQAGQNAAVFEFTSNRAPASSSGAVLEGRTGVYAHWSAPLQRQGNRWRAEIRADNIPTLLTCDQLVARFPGAGTGGADLQVTIPRDRYLAGVENVQALVPNAPLFFTPPAAPERPETPQPNATRAQAEDFVSKAIIFDMQWTVHTHEFASARARAHALFLDLRTSGRMPWRSDVVDRLTRQYDGLKQRQTEIENAREQWRTTARQFVQQWNAAHSGEPPLELTFVNPAA